MRIKIETHKYAPELNRVYLTGKNSSNAVILRAPSVTSVKEARAALFPKALHFRRVVTVESYYDDPRFSGLNRLYSGTVDSYEHLKNVIANIKARNTGPSVRWVNSPASKSAHCLNKSYGDLIMITVNCENRLSLPAVITAPGDYITRSGCRVTITSVGPVHSPYTFPCKGSVWVKFRGSMRPRKFNVWMRSGHLNAVGDHALDIVGPWEGE